MSAENRLTNYQFVHLKTVLISPCNYYYETVQICKFFSKIIIEFIQNQLSDFDPFLYLICVPGFFFGLSQSNGVMCGMHGLCVIKTLSLNDSVNYYKNQYDIGNIS